MLWLRVQTFRRLCVMLAARQVVGALSETEEANDLLKEEIKQLLAEQDEQDELRNELHDQLRERSELMQLMARQTLNDSMSSSDMLDRIRQLREEAEAEKQTFQAEMKEMDRQLQTLEVNDIETQARLGPLDDVD
jgi:flagellar motility protein MotE (MotC chaperone)